MFNRSKYSNRMKRIILIGQDDIDIEAVANAITGMKSRDDPILETDKITNYFKYKVRDKVI